MKNFLRITNLFFGLLLLMSISITAFAESEDSSWIFLNSTVFSGTDASGSYTYQSISGYGIGYNNSASIHIEPKSSSYSLSSDRKSCTVTTWGVPTTKEGVALTVKKSYKCTFTAG